MEDASDYVLFDCHDPKGPHAHRGQATEELFVWVSLDDAIEKFQSAVEEKFGKVKEW